MKPNPRASARLKPRRGHTNRGVKLIKRHCLTGVLDDPAMMTLQRPDVRHPAGMGDQPGAIMYLADKVCHAN